MDHRFVHAHRAVHGDHNVDEVAGAQTLVGGSGR